MPNVDDLVHRRYASSEFREEVAAFLVKRQPDWSKLP